MKRKWLVFFSVVLMSVLEFCTLSYAMSPMFQTEIPAPPETEARLVGLWADSQGSTIMEYDLGRIEEDKTYFTDGHPLFNLDDKESLALANTPFLLPRFVKEHGLIQLPSGDGAEWNGISMSTYSATAPKCEWPYNTALEIRQKGRRPISVIFLRRRSVPEVERYEFWCEGGTGATDLTTEFENLTPGLYLELSGRPLLAFIRPAVVFRLESAGTAIPSHLAPDIIVVPAGLSWHLRTMAAEGELNPQLAVRLFEAEVHAISATEPEWPR